MTLQPVGRVHRDSSAEGFMQGIVGQGREEEGDRSIPEDGIVGSMAATQLTIFFKIVRWFAIPISFFLPH